MIETPSKPQTSLSPAQVRAMAFLQESPDAYFLTPTIAPFQYVACGHGTFKIRKEVAESLFAKGMIEVKKEEDMVNFLQLSKAGRQYLEGAR